MKSKNIDKRAADGKKEQGVSASAKKAKKQTSKKTKTKTDAKKTSVEGKKKNIKFLGGLLLKKMAFGGAKELSSNADEVNKLNVFPVPDGDTGDNMRMTIESGISAVEDLDTDDVGEVMKSFSHGMLLGARGNSGVILSQFFAGTAKGLESADKADPKTLGHALELGVEQAYSSVMTPTEGTILTVAREAVEYAVSRINADTTIQSLFSDLCEEMNRSLERTPEILTVLKDAGVVDSGAAGLYHIIDGFNRVLSGKSITKSTKSTPMKSIAKPASVAAFGPDSVMTYGYCTEFLLQLQNSKTDVDTFDVDALKSFLVSVGDSVVAFKTESIVKVHVHTLVPEKVLEYARRYGEFLTVKIENMSLQHSEGELEKEKIETQAREKKKYGVVSVCCGEGIENLFRELGCDIIVTGGQTHNPSTNDFIEAFAKISAENIIVFPNNGNIFMAANQAAELYSDAKIHIVPSKNIGMGYVALSSMNFDSDDVNTVLEEMNAAMSRVTSAQISPTIRDADMNGIHINNGDTIGIIDKEIVLSDPDRSMASRRLADMLLSMDGKFMLTVICGNDAEKGETEKLEQDILTDHPDAEVYFIEGGQDIYPYIFIAE